MKYLLRLRTLGQHPEIEIDQDRFFCLKRSKVVLDEALAFEEKYEMVIYNYLDLEKEVADVSLSSMVRSIHGYAGFFDARLSLNVRLVNLLTWVRVYTDQLAGHLSACLPFPLIENN
jgi:hypothetical protein